MQCRELEQQGTQGGEEWDPPCASTQNIDTRKDFGKLKAFVLKTKFVKTKSYEGGFHAKQNRTCNVGMGRSNRVAYLAVTKVTPNKSIVTKLQTTTHGPRNHV